jgi:hypothetical protein
MKWLRRLFAPRQGCRATARRARLAVEALEDRTVPTVTYHGGALLSHVEAQAVYLGSDWSTNPTLNQTIGNYEQYLSFLVNSGYMDMLSNAGYRVGRGSATAGRIDSLGIDKTRVLFEAQIQTELQAQISAGTLAAPDANRLYVVFVEPDVEVRWQYGDSTQGSLGYHGAFAGQSASGSAIDIHYAVIFYPGGSVGNSSIGSQYSAFQSQTVIASHEVAEAATDPDINYKQLGWYDASNSAEIGDLAYDEAGAGAFVSYNGYLVQAMVDQNSQLIYPSGSGPTQAATATSLSVSNASPSLGQPVTFTATVSSSGGTPSGVVTFSDGGTLLGQASLDASGNASFTTLSLTVGPHSIVASYGGTSAFQGSQSSPVAVTVSQGTAATTTALTASPDSIQAGQPVTFTAVVSGPAGSGTPTGTVTFLEGTTTLGAAWLDANGRATFTTSTLPAGSHTVTAVYGGDSAFSGSQSAAVTVLVSAVAVPPPANLVAAASALAHSEEYYEDFIRAAYLKYLGRTPSPAEVTGWRVGMQSGVSDERLEAYFIGSREYIANHGGPGAGWVVGLYQDLLGRTPAQSEVDGWVYALSHGVSPQQVAYGFAASNEREAIRVNNDYMTYLGRAASQAEVQGWVYAFEHGVSNENVIAGFVGSKESFDRAGDDIPTWVENAYQSILGRPVDPGALAHWTAILEQG